MPTGFVGWQAQNGNARRRAEDLYYVYTREVQRDNNITGLLRTHACSRQKDGSPYTHHRRVFTSYVL